MIPAGEIAEWRQRAPWSQDLQVEQDLILSRALVELFEQPTVARSLALRGGTALFKLLIRPALRYSEDIDLVQLTPEPIGPTLDAIRQALDPWLGTPKRKFNEGRVTLVYRMTSEGPPPLPLRLKIEINTREHFSVFGIHSYPFAVRSRWFDGEAAVASFHPEELLATKLRALYQRKKGRDLFDLVVALERLEFDLGRIIEALSRYMEHDGTRVSRAQFEENLQSKLMDPRFITDLRPLLSPGIDWDFEEGAAVLRGSLIELLPGEPWKGRE